MEHAINKPPHHVEKADHAHGTDQTKQAQGPNDHERPQDSRVPSVVRDSLDDKNDDGHSNKHTV
eukprot:CAMPEP_0117487096 /NCGR_PEP_ID=MMETSP0784-20121206/15818_1 /TAXON_ID=39447 /ORGANISM="" /LENGTH=63 /DNA_ID=CAMNT_0005281731 /DNA_START=255 /DNA_END=446 /DNA_ORIENTATION=-